MKNLWAALGLLSASFLICGYANASELLLSDEEIASALSHGPWPPPKRNDPSNRVSGNAAAIELGRQLFSSPMLSGNGQTSCASCHNPELSFTDGLPRGQGQRTLDRNTPALFNLRHHRWFGWAGNNDNLWAQSIAPFKRQDEMALADHEATKVMMEPEFKAAYTALFGAPGSRSDEQNVVNIGKALAAYQETLETGRTTFDVFRDALAAGDLTQAAQYPAAAQRGLSIFVGTGNCSFCHSGPFFSNGEFHDAGVPYFVEPGRVDSGRHGGIKALSENPFTLDGAYNDDPEKSGAWAVRQVASKHADFGTFRTPSLRGAAATAPYMHNGSLTTLEDVVRHYSNIDLERMHADGEAILVPLQLSDQQVSDVVQFLRSLSEPGE